MLNYNDNFNTSVLSQMYNYPSIQILFEIPKYISNTILLIKNYKNKAPRITKKYLKVTWVYH